MRDSGHMKGACVISYENQPISDRPSDSDFTQTVYRDVVRLALASYSQANYRDIPWASRFILWRHDCDFSLNRALAIGKIEFEEGLRSTFFLNPHCEFYNLFEATQFYIVKELIRLGHDIGLHFDATFYSIDTENELHKLIQREADCLEQLFGIRPAAFSFHNPTAFLLSCEADSYGGLLNCYSRRFKTEVSYCSDSNGYWRFRRLKDVLEQSADACLQVLTHPGWWQDKPMPPRNRIFRSAYGRAEATMRLYDEVLQGAGRKNLNGAGDCLRFLAPISQELFELLDYLWNRGKFQTLYVELWRLHERQINNLCKAVFCKEWTVAARDVNAFFESPDLVIDGWQLFVGVFDKSWQEATGIDEATHKEWVRLRNQLVYGRSVAPRELLEAGCLYMCRALESLAALGMSQPIMYDGLAQLAAIGIPTYKTADGKQTDRLEEIAGDIAGSQSERWESLKSAMSKVGADETARGTMAQRVLPRTDSGR